MLGQNTLQARGDPRLGKKGVGKVDILQTAQQAIVIEVPIEYANFYVFASGYLTRALEKGFAASSDEDYYPYFAWIYIANLLSQYASGSVPPALKLPFVLHCIGRALTTKTVGMDNGKVTYAFIVNPTTIPAPNLWPVGYDIYGYVFYMGAVPPTPPLINGFPVMTIVGFPTYTVELGAAAFANMNLFLANKMADNDDFKLVNSTSPTPFDKDVSSFALMRNQQGLGFAGVASGGFGQLATLEVPIFRPLLSLLQSFPVPGGSGEAARYPNLIQNVAGDASTLGAYLGTLIPVSNQGVKRPIKFHVIDFNEFLETIAFWMQGLMNASVSDPLGTWSTTNPPTNLTCPLTLQEVALLLRNTMMECFKDTQAGVQGLYPVTPSAGTDFQYVPFTAHVGTCFLESVPWNLPTAIVENLRDLVVRYTQRSKTDFEFFVPVLSEFRNDLISDADFTYIYAATEGDPVAYPVFKPATMAENKRRVFNDKKQIMEDILVAETAVSFVDGSSSAGYLAINDPAVLTVLAGSWDDWLKSTGLSTYSMTLSPFSAEIGINVLYSGAATRHWIGGPDSQNSTRGGRKQPKPPSSTEIVKKREVRHAREFSTRFTRAKHKAILASPYIDRLAIADSFQSVPLTDPYSQIMKVWILPVIENEVLAVDDSTLIPRWQALMKETYLVNSSTGFDGISLSDMHYQYAQKMIKSRTAPDDAWDNFFKEMAAQGRGGILSSLVAGAVGMFFPSAAGIANQIADALPI
jgi:hypothetical protein